MQGHGTDHQHSPRPALHITLLVLQNTGTLLDAVQRHMECSRQRSRRECRMCVTHLECCLDIIVHHLNVCLVYTDGSSSQPARLINWNILQFRTVVPTFFQYQKHFLQQKSQHRIPGPCISVHTAFQSYCSKHLTSCTMQWPSACWGPSSNQLPPRSCCELSTRCSLGLMAVHSSRTKRPYTIVACGSRAAYLCAAKGNNRQ